MGAGDRGEDRLVLVLDVSVVQPRIVSELLPRNITEVSIFTSEDEWNLKRRPMGVLAASGGTMSAATWCYFVR